MMKVDLDWTDPTLDPGARPARVKKATYSTAKSSGDAMIRVEFELTDDAGGKVYCNIMLQGNAKQLGMRRLSQLGVPKGTLEIEVDSLIDREVTLALVTEEWQGENRLAVDVKANSDGFKHGFREIGGQSPVIDTAQTAPVPKAEIQADDTPF